MIHLGSLDNLCERAAAGESRAKNVLAGLQRDCHWEDLNPEVEDIDADGNFVPF
jgi:hypothetical protein